MSERRPRVAHSLVATRVAMSLFDRFQRITSPPTTFARALAVSRLMYSLILLIQQPTVKTLVKHVVVVVRSFVRIVRSGVSSRRSRARALVSFVRRTIKNHDVVAVFVRFVRREGGIEPLGR